MKRARVDDAITMGDSNSYPLGEKEVDDEEEEHEQLERAACDVLLSLSCGSSSSTTSREEAPALTAAPPLHNNKRRRRRRRHRRGQALFDCRTCGRQFATFQALGGHRTSHFRRHAAAVKKLRPKHVVVAHACGMCGLGFSTGQALGGHMRRHRGLTTTTTASDDGSAYVGLTQINNQERPSSASLQLLNLFV
ncbi:unnamed protein product [Urochloa decumbens]|uniref:C2H2-type domain-containing protein n=1 Tax=Urochloa decumbens TaxID=240449 RepID=A0ABC9ANT3_9POAL